MASSDIRTRRPPAPARALPLTAILPALLLATAGAGPIPVEAQVVDADRIAREVEPEVRKMMIEGRVPSATIALVVGDEIVWTGAFGHANLWARTPAVPSTVYLIGSTFKAQSTVALLQQMEAGKFELDDPVRDYLDGLEIRGERADEPVTFRHLLTHTSGLPGDFGPFSVWGDSVPADVDDYLARDLEVIAAPRDTVVYSNMAYTLVAHLVETFSGIPYRDYIREHVWGPLEMGSTEFVPTPEMDERIAVPYALDEETERPVPTVRLKAQVWPAGIVYGTVENQANWLIMNLDGGAFRGRRLLDPGTVDLMHTLQFDHTGPMSGGWGYDPERTGYGLTWWVSTDGEGDRYFAHSGSVPGYTAFISGNRTDRVGVALLTNGHRAHPHLVRLTKAVLEILERHVEEETAADGS